MSSSLVTPSTTSTFTPSQIRKQAGDPWQNHIVMGGTLLALINTVAQLILGKKREAAESFVLFGFSFFAGYTIRNLGKKTEKAEIELEDYKKAIQIAFSKLQKDLDIANEELNRVKKPEKETAEFKEKQVTKEPIDREKETLISKIGELESQVLAAKEKIDQDLEENGKLNEEIITLQQTAEKTKTQMEILFEQIKEGYCNELFAKDKKIKELETALEELKLKFDSANVTVRKPSKTLKKKPTQDTVAGGLKQLKGFNINESQTEEK